VVKFDTRSRLFSASNSSIGIRRGEMKHASFMSGFLLI
jgi:hypothetical protein